MLRIKVNKDITNYSEGLFLGLSMKEMGNYLLSVIVAVASIGLFSLMMPFTLAVYAAIPFIALTALSGRKFGNLSIKEIIEYYPTYKRLKKGIEYSSTECPEEIESVIENTQDTTKEDINKQLKKAIISIGVVIGIIITIILWLVI